VLALAAVPAGVFLADVKAGYAQGGFGCLLAVFVFGWVFEGAGADDHLVVGSDGRLVVANQLDQAQAALGNAKLG
jgi:hypothetical protein